MSLLKQLENAVKLGQIKEPFTTSDFKEWISEYNIINNKTGNPYSESYIEGFLSSSVVTSSSTKKDKKLEKLDTSPVKYRFK